MENIIKIEREGNVCPTCLEDTDTALNDLGEKDVLRIAMSGYYLLYR
jgi:hypothetical protein